MSLKCEPGTFFWTTRFASSRLTGLPPSVRSQSENGDAVLAVALDFDVVGVLLRHSGVLQRDGESLLASDLRALRRSSPDAEHKGETESGAGGRHSYFHNTFLPDGIVVYI